jgi:paraquat-inducible protein A
MSAQPRAHHLGLVRCHACALACEDTSGTHAQPRCPRCGTALHRRRPDSLARAWALLLAGAICYVPANVLPVMYTQMPGGGGDSTIMSGVAQFWHHGAYGIALVIFVASVVVPCTKFLVLALLLATSQRRGNRARRARATLYRMVEAIGYWSMLDVLVVAIVAALVRFQALGRIEPRVGIVFFGVVVILTMLSAMSFDPRLIWDSDTE